MTITNDALPQAHQLIEFIREKIPLAHTMDLRLVGYDIDTLSLLAPLAPNIND
ncbi:MAG: YiiD C-terminal domain-containing protein, partial [Rhodanobacter sp.]